MSTEAAAAAPLVMFGTAGRYANAIYAASAKKGEASGSSGELLAETSAGGPVEKKQKPVNSEKREKEKKKSLKRL